MKFNGDVCGFGMHERENKALCTTKINEFCDFRSIHWVHQQTEKKCLYATKNIVIVCLFVNEPIHKYRTNKKDERKTKKQGSS